MGTVVCIPTFLAKREYGKVLEPQLAWKEVEKDPDSHIHEQRTACSADFNLGCPYAHGSGRLRVVTSASLRGGSAVSWVLLVVWYCSLFGVLGRAVSRQLWDILVL